MSSLRQPRLSQADGEEIEAEAVPAVGHVIKPWKFVVGDKGKFAVTRVGHPKNPLCGALEEHHAVCYSGQAADKLYA